MTTTPKVGRSREELLAASAALTAAVAEVDDGDAAELLARRSDEFGSEAWDAPPISAAGEVTDDMLLEIFRVGVIAGVVGFLSGGRSNVPDDLVEHLAASNWARMSDNPMVRQELLDGGRNLLAGRCACGEPEGHSHGGGDEQ